MLLPAEEVISRWYRLRCDVLVYWLEKDCFSIRRLVVQMPKGELRECSALFGRGQQVAYIDWFRKGGESLQKAVE
jgi:hypothetical protein